MTSTSPYRGFEIPTVSSDSGTWGTLINDTIEYVDSILGQTTTLPSTTYGTDITLSSSQARCVRIDVTSASTAEFTIHLLSSCYAQGLYVVKNGTGGELTCQSGSTANVVVLESSTTGIVTADGTNVYAAAPAATGEEVYTAARSPTYWTRTVYTTGSGTYITPTNCKAIHVRMVGGGAGGGGSGTSLPLSGSGGATSFGPHTANGGTGSANSGGGAGGGYTIGAGAVGFGCIGGGGNGGANQMGVSQVTTGGKGGDSMFGGGANSPLYNGGGNAGYVGGGGAGGGSNNVVGAGSGGGGGSGGGVDIFITSPDASYGYMVGGGGTAGAAGTSGLAGGAGGAGLIVIDEYY